MPSRFKFFTFLFIISGFLSTVCSEEKSTLNWLTSLDEAVSQAQKTEKKILVYFSGSDWCRPCMLLRLEVFDKDIFKKFAGDSLVLLQFDFPARSKNKLSEEQQKQNDQMAELFNKDGVFPKVLILDKNTSVLGEINSYRQGGAADIIEKIKKMLH